MLTVMKSSDHSNSVDSSHSADSSTFCDYSNSSDASCSATRGNICARKILPDWAKVKPLYLARFVAHKTRRIIDFCYLRTDLFTY